MLDFIRQKYRSQNQSRVPSPRCRDSGPYFFPKRTLRRARSNRQRICPKPARFARTRAPRVSWWTVYYLTQFLSLVLGNHARNAFRKAPSPYPPIPCERCGTRPKARRVCAGPERAVVRLPAEACPALVASRSGVTMSRCKRRPPH